MHFKSTVMPGVRAFASTMRVRLCRDPMPGTRPGTLYSPPTISPKAQARATWRVCPMTGQLQQRWSFDDSQEPPSRSLARLFEQAGLMLGLYLGARTFS